MQRNKEATNIKGTASIPVWVWLIAILALALFLRLAGIWRAEPIDYDPDEWVIARPVMSIANNAQVGLKTHYKWSGCGLIYSIGYTLFLLHRWFGPYSYNSILILLRVISAIVGTTVVFMVFLLIRKLASAKPALLAAALVAIAKLPVRLDHEGSIRSIAALIILSVMLLSYDLFNVEAVKDRQRLKTGKCCLLGLLCGFGISVKWTVLLTAIPISIAFLLTASSHRKSPNWPIFCRLNFKRIAIIAGITALTFLAATPDFMLAPQKVISGFTYEMQHHKVGHYGSVTGESAPLTTRLQRTIISLSKCGSIYMLIPGIAATIFCLLRPNRLRIFLAVVFFLWLVIVIRNLVAPERHHLIPFIIMLLMTSIALGALLEKSNPRIKTVCYVVFVLIIAFGLLYTCIFISPYWKPDARTECSNWIKANIPQGSGITWAPRTYNWMAPGQIITPWLFKLYPRKAEPGKEQYIIAANRRMNTFKKHPPTRKIVPSEWFPSEPPTMAELMLYAEMNNAGGPNLTLVKEFRTKPSFLGLDFRLFGLDPNQDTTSANQTVTLFRVNPQSTK
ncbi:MAG: glycosyltransferase family 39 protein [Planctomycetota bacterium]|jgi:hypothetical protein